MKKILSITSILFSLTILYFPLTVLADGTYSITDSSTGNVYTFQYKGLVPCGKCVQAVVPPVPPFAKDEVFDITTAAECQQVGYYWQGEKCYMCDVANNYRYIPCTVCHLFVMIEGAINFILLEIVPIISVLMLVAGGVLFYFGGLSPSQLNQAKSLLISALIGLVIIYGSWVIVNTVLMALGIADWVGFGNGWFQIQCGIAMTM